MAPEGEPLETFCKDILVNDLVYFERLANLFMTVDQFRSGYPRYSALLSAHPSFHNFRRFTRIRMRLLLWKQDELCRLEERFDEIDSRDNHALLLGCMRRDTNSERLQIVQSLSTALAEYGKMRKPMCETFS